MLQVLLHLRVLLHPLQPIKLPLKLRQGVQRLHKMPKSNPLPPSNSQTLRRPRRILDLTSVHTPPRQLRDLLMTDLRSCEAQLAYERRPDLFLGRLGELMEVQRNVDAREEGFVECLDAVRGEEEDAAVVFDMAKARGGRVTG